MNEHERLLNEGPRVAPEPDALGGDADRPLPRPIGSRPRTWSPAGRLSRLVPIGIFGTLILAQHVGLGRYGFVAVAVIWGVAIAIAIARRAKG